MGLRLIRAMEFNNVIIETNIQVALLMITVDRVDESDPLSWMVKSCRKDMAELKCFMVHVKRDGNRCADLMARLRGIQDQEFVPPTELVPLIEEDVICSKRWLR